VSSPDLNVLLLSRYSALQPSSQFRFYQYLPHLRRQGVDVTVATLLDVGYTRDLYANRRRRVGPILWAYWRRFRALLRGRRFDVLWLEGELWPRLPAWGEALLRRLGIPYVVDYDDAIFHRYDQHPNPLYRALLGRKIDAVMRRAALVSAANDYVADRARRAGASRVEYVPTAVDLDKYSVAPPARNPIFTIGWIGTPTSSAYLPLVQPALGEVCRNGRARLVLVGSGPVDLGSIPAEARTWSAETAVAEIQRFDVGIMPLPDNPITRGKSGLKLVQYMACGRATVASPVGINTRIIQDGKTGFLAATSHQWIDALNTLAEDEDRRRAMGEAGRRDVESQYSVQVTAPRLAALLREAAKHI